VAHRSVRGASSRPRRAGARSAVYSLAEDASPAVTMSHSLVSADGGTPGSENDLKAALVRQAGSRGKLEYKGENNRYFGLSTYVVLDDTPDLTKLIDLSASQGGYVSGSDAVSDTSDRIRTGTITFAVPADKYEETIKVLRGYGTVQSFHATSQDVGGQYADLQSRLKNAEAQRDAMLALLSRATSIGDIVNIQNQVGQIEGQIEQLKGQISYIEHNTTYSTVSVNILEAGAPAQTSMEQQ